jgi:regulation of enolase protein 1 (concanavalin A-like superfamily)
MTMTTFNLPSIPGEFHWHIPPLDWNSKPETGLSITAGAKTDWFIDPDGSYCKDNAPCALFTPPDPEFILSARVSVGFGATYDAGTFQIRFQDDLWAKLCFEFSPQKKPMVVSVVTRGVSDDCNSVEIERPEIFLRVAHTPQTLVFHYSHDGRFWNFVRYFTLGPMEELRAGFSAQSPTGEKCTAVFSEINYRPGRLKDNRSGE